MRNQNYSSPKTFLFSIHANEISGASYYFYRQFATYENNVQSNLTDSRRCHSKILPVLPGRGQADMIPTERRNQSAHCHRANSFVPSLLARCDLFMQKIKLHKHPELLRWLKTQAQGPCQPLQLQGDMTNGYIQSQKKTVDL